MQWDEEGDVMGKRGRKGEGRIVMSVSVGVGREKGHVGMVLEEWNAVV